jgi:hypothetical protein
LIRHRNLLLLFVLPPEFIDLPRVRQHGEVGAFLFVG